MPLPHIYVNQNHYYRKLQEFVEQYYLSPFIEREDGGLVGGGKKIILKDGNIEREVNGVMHATRVFIYVEILHQIMGDLFPMYVGNSLSYFEEEYPCLREGQQRNTIILLTRAVASLHEAGRQGEGRTNEWVHEGVQIAKHFLLSCGLDSSLAVNLSNLLYYKDDPELFDRVISALPEKGQSAFHYLRILIGMAVYLDCLRDSNLEMTRLQGYLSFIPEYETAEQAYPLFELAKAIQALLINQYDLYYPTTIIGPDLKEYSIVKGQYHYSPKEKVKIEHARNPIFAMLDSMKRVPYFQKFLGGEPVADPEYYTGPIAFNPFIHGTNSSIFPLLARTDFRVQSPLSLIKNYRLAPFSGELDTRGGFRGVFADSTVCFGLLNKKLSWGYSLDNIIHSYAVVPNSPSLELAQETLQGALDLERAYDTGFTNINSVLFYAARFRQLGGDLSQLEPVKKYQRYFQASLGIYTLYLLLGEHISLREDELDSLTEQERKDCTDAIYTHLNYPALIQKIMERSLDLKAIYQNPSRENVQKIIDLLELPETFIVKKGPAEAPEEITLKLRRLYKIKDNTRTTMPSSQKLTKVLSKGDVGWLLEAQAKKLVQSSDFFLMRDELLEHIHQHERQYRLLTDLMSQPFEGLHLSEIEQRLINHPFPIILCCDSWKNIRPGGNVGEYRATSSLGLGSDIKTVATNTRGNQKILNEYFSSLDLKIQVILFDDLSIAEKRLNNISEKQIPDRRNRLFKLETGEQEAVQFVFAGYQGSR